MADETELDPTTSGFAALGLEARILAGLADLGYEEPTPIQREAIPPLVAGKDLIGLAATGTGKTAAFALPMLHRLALQAEPRQRPAALVLVPTRELAMQVAEATHRYGRALRIQVLPVYGGSPFGRQVQALDRGVDVIVATPGRALDHIRRGTLKLANLGIVVLDEADEMLDMGFAEDIEAILNETPSTRQTMLFSATMPPRIAAMTKKYLSNPVEVKVKNDPIPRGEAPKVRQTAYVVPRSHKLAALGRILDVEAPASAIIFCRTRTEVDALAEALSGRGYRPEALHGGMSQEQRDRVMRLFRAGTADLLIATDVAARGLDVEHLTHVVNFQVPCAIEPYVHRIGRVGRAGREGVAITLAEPREHRLLRNIERATGQKIELTQIPTVADLHARRLELTRAALEEAILAGELDQYRVIVETLAGEHDIMAIALAAIKMAHEADRVNDEDEEIPITPPMHDSRGPGGPGGPGKGGKRGGPPAARRGMTRLFLNLGRDAGISPRDLVGAIAGEAGIPGREIGGIDIADRFSLVEVPDEHVSRVIAALRNCRIRGRKVSARPDRQP